MTKCIGCGVVLTNNSELEGYTSNLEKKLCERCFRIKNYNEYKVVVKDNNDYINILKDINHNDDLVVLVVDLLNIPNQLSDISLYINNKMLLVLTKYDLMPSNNEDKYINFFKQYNLNIVDTVIVSSYNNYHFDLLLDKIERYKTSDKIYVVGYTNAGKSTMINKLIYNYSDDMCEITTSSLPSTTLNTIEIKLNGLTFIDTPGLLDNSILNYIDTELIKKVIPKKKIRPITYQVKGRQIITVENFLKIDCCSTNITLYISNNLNIKRYYKDNNNMDSYNKYTFDVVSGNDVVISGLGFIHVSKTCKMNIYVIGDTSVFTRTALIGG